MRVVVIDSIEAFVALEQDWSIVQGQDTDAGYFLSWQWLAVVFRANPGKWRVLAARPQDDPGGYVCFLPLWLDLHWSRSRTQFCTELEAGGRLSWAQYTGFICIPDWEEKALVAMAAELRKLPWSYFSITNWLESARRRELFLSGFEPDDYEVSFKDRAPAEGEVDNRVCPFVPLPDTFEEYLTNRVSSNTRQKIRRFSRRLEQSVDLRVELTYPGIFDENLDILLAFWFRKWAPVRGRGSAERAVQKYREILAQSLACDAVFMPILWSGETPLGGLVNIVDRHKRQMYFIVAGRDEEASDPFIGLVLHAYSIRWAIENNLKVYDLCHGNEPYKYSLGAVEKRLDHLIIRRRSRVEIGHFDPANMAVALDVTAEFVAAGRIDDTVSACRQLAELCL